MAVWRRDDQVGQSFCLKLTAAGMKAIAVDDEGDSLSASNARSEPANDEANKVQTARSQVASITAPREGTKMARVVGLLQRDDGATLAELIAATDWLPHTTRAALTGLRKRGYPVTLDRTDKARGSAYGIPLNHGGVDAKANSPSNEPPPAPATRSKKANQPTKPEPAALATAGTTA